MGRIRWLLLPLAAMALSAADSGQTPNRNDADRLATMLERAANYCRKLDRAALDFVCLEEVTEMADRHTRQTDVFLYDYQFIRKKDEVKEQRNLVAVDGRKAHRPLPPIQPAAFRYKNVLFGPIGLLSESWQVFHSYRIVGEERLFDEKAVVYKDYKFFTVETEVVY